jgi:hypothetical protein
MKMNPYAQLGIFAFFTTTANALEKTLTILEPYKNTAQTDESCNKICGGRQNWNDAG